MKDKICHKVTNLPLSVGVAVRYSLKSSDILPLWGRVSQRLWNPVGDRLYLRVMREVRRQISDDTDPGVDHFR